MKVLLLLLGIGLNFIVGSEYGSNEEIYMYEITDANYEIYGDAINKKSHDNYGIFLYSSELDFEVEKGDVISIVWGDEEDEFKSIIKVYDNK